MSLFRFFLPAAGMALLVLPAPAQQPAGGAPAPAAAPAPARAAPADDAATIAAQKPSYPLVTCLICGAALDGAHGPTVEVVLGGRYVAFCSRDCTTEFEKSPVEHLAKLDAAVVAAQKAGYPLTTCVAKGEPLVAGKAKDVVIGTRLVLVCCGSCKKQVQSDPQPALAKVDAALIEQQSRDYPLTVCLVSDEDMEGQPVKLLHGTTLAQFCCKDCRKEFIKDPAPYLAKLAAARAAQAGSKPGSAPPSPEGGAPEQKPGG